MRIAITGFYGHGNLGDEAMLRGLSTWFRSKGHQVFLLTSTSDKTLSELRDAYVPTVVDEVCDIYNRTVVRVCDLLLIGGGDLAPGFGWQLVPAALMVRKPIVSVGMSFPRDRWLGTVEMTELNKAVLGAFKLIVPRDPASIEVLHEMGLRNVQLGSDPALLLCSLVDHGAKTLPGVVPLFVRYPDDPGLKQRLVNLGASVAGSLIDAGASVVLHSCNRYDLEMSGAVLDLEPRVGMRELNLDPVQAMQALSGSSLVVSLMRLHPAIFAASLGVPFAVVGEYCADKIDNFAQSCDSLGRGKQYSIRDDSDEEILEAVMRAWQATRVDPTRWEIEAVARLNLARRLQVLVENSLLDVLDGVIGHVC